MGMYDEYGTYNLPRELKDSYYRNCIDLMQQQALSAQSYADYGNMASTTATDTRLRICEGSWVTFKGHLLGRVYLVHYERLAVEIQDMETGERMEYPQNFLWKCEYHTKKPETPQSMKFNIGDRVKNTTHEHGTFGREGVITNIYSSGEYYEIAEIKKGYWYKPQDLTLSEKEKTMSSVSDKFAALLKGEPEKSFFKAGLTNKDDSFTAEGKQVFEAWLLKKFKSEFNTEVVQPILEEMKEERK